MSSFKSLTDNGTIADDRRDMIYKILTKARVQEGVHETTEESMLLSIKKQSLDAEMSKITDSTWTGLSAIFCWMFREKWAVRVMHR